MKVVRLIMGLFLVCSFSLLNAQNNGNGNNNGKGNTQNNGKGNGRQTSQTTSATDGQVLTLVNGGASWADASGDGIYSGNGTTPTDLEVTVLDSIEFDDGTLFIDAVDHRIGVNEDKPTSILHANGSVAYAVDNFTATSTNSYDMEEDNHILMVNTNNSSAVINLPAANTCTGRVYQFIKRNGANSMIFNLNIRLNTGGTASTFTSTRLKIISDGADWVNMD